MTTTENPGLTELADPPAFPREDYQTDSAPGQRGMSLRDYFAGQALVGTILDQASWGVDHSKSAPDFARIAYDIADAMLALRARGAQQP